MHIVLKRSPHSPISMVKGIHGDYRNFVYCQNRRDEHVRVNASIDPVTSILQIDSRQHRWLPVTLFQGSDYVSQMCLCGSDAFVVGFW